MNTPFTIKNFTLTNNEKIIEETKNWILKVVIGCNFCPFANKEFKNETIKYEVDTSETIDMQLENLKSEFEFLKNNTSTETTLIIYPTQYNIFSDFLFLVDDAEKVLKKAGYYGVFQLATFHPDYCFEGEDIMDASNFTNRSIYPMLHILREESVYKIAEKHEKDLALIPEKNITYALDKGYDYMKLLRDSCKL